MKRWLDLLISIDFWISVPLLALGLPALLISFLGDSIGMAFLIIIALIPVIGIGIVLYILYKKPKS